METKNIYLINQEIAFNNKEIFEKLIEKGDILIERIISSGQITPEDKWYKQEKMNG